MEDDIEMTLGEVGGGVWTGWSGSEWGPMAGPCEQGNEPSGSVVGREFIDLLSGCWLLGRYTAPWSFIIVIPVEHGFEDSCRIGIGDSFSGGKAARAWSSQLTFI
jgi:hypothetical protein